MPARKPNPQKRSMNKQKRTSRQAANKRTATQPRRSARPRSAMSESQRSQGRYPGETPLTGEDRPTNRAGGNKQGQSARASRP